MANAIKLETVTVNPSSRTDVPEDIADGGAEIVEGEGPETGTEGDSFEDVSGSSSGARPADGEFFSYQGLESRISRAADKVAYFEAARYGTELLGVETKRDGAPSAMTLLRIGEAYKSAGRVDEALEMFRRSLAVEELPKTLVELGVLLRKRGELQGSEDALRRALVVEKNPECLCPVYVELGITLYKKEGPQGAEQTFRMAERSGQANSALMNIVSSEIGNAVDDRDLAAANYYYRVAARLNALSQMALTKLGMLYNSAGLYPEAVIVFRKLLALQPSCRGYLGLGEALQGVGDIEGAREVYKMGDRGRRIDILKEQSFRAMKRNDHVEALQCYIELLGIEMRARRPSAITLYNIGAVYKIIGGFDRAVKAFKWALKIEEHPRTFCELGVTLRIMGDLEGSKKALDQAITLDRGSHARPFCELGTTLREMGDLAGSKEALQIAIKMENGKIAHSLSELGITLREMGDLEGSKAVFERAIAAERHNTNGHMFCELGITLREMGDMGGSKEMLEKAIRLGGDRHPHSFCELGVTLSKMGELEGSKAALERAIELEPTRGRPFCELGITLRAMGDLEGSKAALERAIELNSTQGRNFNELRNTLRELARDAV